MTPPHVFALAALAALASCTPGDHAPDVVADAALVADAACMPDRLPLEIDRHSADDEQLYVAVGYRGSAAAMLVDTGSELTFIQEPLGSPDPVRDAGSVELACSSLALIGRPEGPLGTTASDVPVIGTFGTDQLLAGPSHIDLAASEIVRHAAGVGFPEAATWPAAPYDVAYGIVLAHATLDGVSVRLEVDTGASTVVWVGVPAQPGDIEIDAEDAAGNPITIYQGTCELALGGQTTTVSCGRIPSWPYFDEGVALLGGNIQGLVGLAALGNGFVIDTDAKLVRVDVP